MKDAILKGLAFCTILVLVLSIAKAEGDATPSDETYEKYRRERLSVGAQTFPLIAQLTHKQALEALRSGNTDHAVTLLKEAQQLDPNYADLYFTLARIKAKQRSSDTLYYLSKAFTALWTSFHHQRLFVLNGILLLLLTSAVLSVIYCFAFFIKYLPFATHKLREVLTNKFHPAVPGLLSYLILLIPLALLPSFITATALLILISWGFMLKREKLFTILIILPFIALGFFSNQFNNFAPLMDPASLTSRIAAANESAGDRRLIAALEQTPAGALEAEKDLALGLLYLRSEHFMPAATHFLRTISSDPKNQMAYVNLGNVYYLQGEYNKALEGYRKAAALDPLDAVCQYNLAQGYIKTLLLAESSKALRQASASGIEKVKQSYAPGALKNFPVYPKTFSPGDLWRISLVEGENYIGTNLGNVLIPITRFPPRVCAWILLGALILAIIISRLVNSRRIAFQCSNCGELTCEDCCSEDRGGYYCKGCAEAIDGVLSEKVIDALLRQRRQAVIVKRRKSLRFLTVIIPGVRDMYYGRILRGISIAALFAFSLLFLWTGGLLIKDWTSILTQTSPWKMIFAIAAVAATYWLSIFSKPPYDIRSFRSPGTRFRMKESGGEETSTGAAA